MYTFVEKSTEDKTMKKLWKNEEGVSPVIAVILMVAITVVLAAVLYVMVSGMMTETETTPRGSLTFSDTDISYKYTGQFQGSVKLDKVDISIYDANLDETIVKQAPTGDFSLSTSSGFLNLTYDDVQPDGKLDASDTLILTGAQVSDKVMIVWKATGETVGSDTIA